MAVAISGLTLTQSGTDTTLEVFNTAITAIPLVARNTAYTLNTVLKPIIVNGFFYRCSVAGTTAATEPVYTPTLGATIVDGTATFIAILASTKQIVGSKTIYRINSFQVIINGTLTYDAKLEAVELIDCTTSPVLRLNNGCNLTINSLINTKPTYEEAIVIKGATNTVQTEFLVDVGSRFNLNGGKVVVSGIGSSNYQSIYWNKGATINITDGWLKSSKNQSRIGESGSGNILGFNINRLIVEKIGFTIFGILGNLQGLSPLGSSVQLVAYGSFTTLTVRDFNPQEATSSIDNWDIQNVFLDNAISSGITILGGGQNGINRWATMRKEVVVQILNVNNAPIQNAISYIRDTNNGGRIEVLGIPSQLSDNVYLQTTLSTGLTPVFKVYILHGKSIAGVSQQVTRDYRSKTTVAGQDLFDIHTWAYSGQYKALTNTPLIGTGTLTVSSILLTDTNVTLNETQAVAKLASSFTVVGNVLTVTANSTLDDVYDVMKAYKTRPVQVQVEFPTISTQPVNASGTALTTSMTIVVNSGVVLSGGTKFKSITSTGTMVITGNAISNITIVGNVIQNIPTNLTNVVITGTLTYNTATNNTITFTNSTFNIVKNDGVGIVTIAKSGSTTITDFSDPEINFLNAIKLNISGLVSGSDVVVLQAGTETVLDQVDQNITSSWEFSYKNLTNVDISVFKAGYIPFYIRNYPLQLNDTSLPVSQIIDRNYIN